MSAEEADMMDEEMLAAESGALFWSMKLEQNSPQEIDQPAIPGFIVHVTNACFGPSVIKGSRTVVMVNPSQDPSDTSSEAPVCVLRQGQHENQSLDLLFNESATISIKGQKPSPVYLTGYLQPPVEKTPLDPMVEDMEEEELEEMMRRQRAQQRALDGEDGEDMEDDEPTLVDDAEESVEAPAEPPSKKQKTGKGAAKSTKNGTESPKKRKQAAKDDEDTKQEEAAAAPAPAAAKKKKDKKKMQNMKGGIKYRDMKVGTGPELKVGDTVSVFYVGQLDDKKVFDKAITGDGFEFQFGKGDVIKGWDLGLKGMKVGGKRKLIIPSKLAYGANGSPPAVPPNAQLTFTIEIKQIK